MIEIALLLGGAAVGAGVAWTLLRAEMRAAVLAEREGREARLGAAEALADEAKKLLTQRELDLGDLRAALGAERTERAQAEAYLQATRQSLEEQKHLLAEARERLGETFKALSSDALRESGQQFLELARAAIDAQLGQRQEAMAGLLGPLAEALRRYEAGVHALEANRQQAYGSLQQQLTALAATSVELQREAGNLASALRAPQVRGRWGEITLRRVVELAGMASHSDFTEQATITTEGGRLRPDLVVHLPAGRDIVVDAKAPLGGYLEAAAARTEEERAVALGRHAQQVRQHVARLGDKAYWEQFPQAPEVVVMFVPVEAAVAGALELDPALLEDGMTRKVLLATPTTLIGLLLAIAYGWRQEQVAASAAQVSDLGRLLYDRLRILAQHFADVGDKLGKATDAFNRTVGSLETRVLPAARRFRELGAATGEDIPALERVDRVPRQLAAPEAVPGLPDRAPEAAPSAEDGEARA